MRYDLLRGIGDPFDGTPEHFWSWRNQLSIHLAEADCGPLDTLYVMLHNTSGQPKDLVQNLINTNATDPAVTLQIAWYDLERRFGSETAIARRLLNKLDAFPKIKSPSQTVQMEGLLSLCRSIMGSMQNCSELGVLNYRSGLQRIWEKMPETFINRWRREFIRSVRNNGRTPDLTDLFQSISDFVEEHTDPNFFCGASYVGSSPRALQTNAVADGSPRLRVESLDRGQASPRRESTRGTSSTCLYHQLPGHLINVCERFRALPLDDRRMFASKHSLCYRCLGPHMASNCDSKTTCPLCSGNHCKAMHRFSTERTPDVKGKNPNFTPVQPRNNCTVVCNVKGTTNYCCSKTIPVLVRLAGSAERIKVFCIIDEQSNISFCDPALPALLGAATKSTSYSLTTMSGTKSAVDGFTVADIEVRGFGEDAWITLPDLLTHPYIPDTSSESATMDIVSAHPHVRHLAKFFPRERPDLKVMLLLGVNSGAALGTKPYGSTYPYVHHTSLGWALVGPVCTEGAAEEPSFKSLRTNAILNNCEHFSAERNFDESCNSGMVPRKFDVFLQREDDDLPGTSREDSQFSGIMKRETTVNKGGNLQLPVPLKKDAVLPNNKGAVFHRTKNTLDRIAGDPVMAARCVSAMGKYIDAGHVEQVPQSSCDAGGLVCHIPVFPVYRPDKDKTRLVFDSSASYNGLSLNGALLRGPDVCNRLLAVLLRFRLHTVGFAADVECMFHAFHVPPEHRDLLRFFWWNNNDPSEKLATYRAKVHIFGNKSSPAVATYGLRYAAAGDHARDFVQARKFINENFYVDDGMGSARTPEEAVQVLADSRTILSKYNIRLHKIVASDPSVLAEFPQSELAQDLVTVDISNPPHQSALGITWRIGDDTLNLKGLLLRKGFTKREILSVNGSVFDPLGMASPVSLGGRLLQRKFISPSSPESQVSKYDWDDPLPEEYLPEWQRWVDQLESLPILSIKRCYAQPDSLIGRTVQLCVFADASQVAIGHVIYMRILGRDGSIHISFVYANSKVAPRSATNIPRLELCAAVEAAQSANYVSRELCIHRNDVIFFSDSKIVLGYLNNQEKSFTKYVTARVGHILRFCEPSQWKYVSTRENPADLATRSCTVRQLQNTAWFTGPEFLTRPYPFTELSAEAPVDLPETIQVSKVLRTNLVNSNDTFDEVTSMTNAWSKMVGIMACLLKFLHLCRRQSYTTAQLLNRSVDLLIVNCQRESFPHDYARLSDGKALQSSSNILKLSPFLDRDNVMRVGGRLRNSDYPFDEKHPRLLPSDHRVTAAIASFYHERTFHQGRVITAANLRLNGFYILKQGKVVSRLVSSCVVCRKLRHSPRAPLMADLPADRLEKTPPFQYSGADVFGPYEVHDGQATRKSSSVKKVWVLLLTCLYSRAVHVELLQSLDITSLKLALRRFQAVRGECSLYRSDCGTNFVGAENLLKSDSECALLLEDSPPDHEWKFLPPHASHFAGVWERKVGSIKNVLNVSMSLVGARRLSREEFSTLLQEAVAIVNNTPLGDSSASPDDPYPVTPASLLTLKEDFSTCTPKDYDVKDLLAYGRRRHRRVQFLAEQFWLRWRRDYLKALQVRRKWRSSRRNLEVGDVVVVRENVPRNCWPMGIVAAVKVSSDGVVRSCTIQLKPNKSGSARTACRAVHDLVLLVPNQPPPSG